MRKCFLICLTLGLVFGMSINSSAATVYLQSWDLVDSGKHSDYAGTTQYMDEFLYGVRV